MILTIFSRVIFMRIIMKMVFYWIFILGKYLIITLKCTLVL